MPAARAEAAVRAAVSGRVQGVGFRDATVRRASELGVLGWVRNADDGTVAVHAEGSAEAVDALVAWLDGGP
ncbi:MAG TPA: acylphosphatase, partial [Capillimicrobium sp.]